MDFNFILSYLLGGIMKITSVELYSEGHAEVITNPRVGIINNGDGTWTAFSTFPGTIIFPTGDTFQINDVNGVILDPDTYQITTTAY